jgi:hypothetical protein
MGTAFQLYLSDHDDTFPLGWGQDAAGVHMWDFAHYVPADYPVGAGGGAGGDGSYARRVVASPSAWANSIQSYVRNWDMYAGPGLPAVSGGGVSLATPATGKRRVNVTYTYNGLLSGYGASGVASPSRLPLAWPGRGKAAMIGGSLANPTLFCQQANLPCSYVPSVAGCNAAINGQQSVMFTLSGSMWVYTQGGNFVSADTSAKFRRLGAQLAPQDTNFAVDPYTGYNAQGFPGFYWWDGCHAWLFRPDYQNL